MTVNVCFSRLGLWIFFKTVLLYSPDWCSTQHIASLSSNSLHNPPASVPPVLRLEAAPPQPAQGVLCPEHGHMWQMKGLGNLCLDVRCDVYSVFASLPVTRP